MHDSSTSAVEVTHVSKHGFWLLLDAEELLIPFEHFPGSKRRPLNSFRMCCGRRPTIFTGRNSTPIFRSSQSAIRRSFRWSRRFRSA